MNLFIFLCLFFFFLFSIIDNRYCYSIRMDANNIFFSYTMIYNILVNKLKMV